MDRHMTIEHLYRTFLPDGSPDITHSMGESEDSKRIGLLPARASYILELPMRLVLRVQLEATLLVTNIWLPMSIEAGIGFRF